MAVCLSTTGIPVLCYALDQEKNDAPNILVILTDDQRFDSLGYSGNPLIKTPNLDRLAREGTFFSNAFVVTAMCCPSRATLLTGQYWWRHGVRTNYQDLPKTIDTWPLALRRVGYRTLFVGKWHLGEWANGPSIGPSHSFEDSINVKITPGGKIEELSFNGKDKPLSGNLIETLTDGAIDLIRQHRDSHFAMLLAYTAPHPPHRVPPQMATMYGDIVFPLPKTYLVEWPKMPRLVQMSKFNTDTLRRLYVPEKNWRNTILGYARMVSAIDGNVGRILNELETLGLTNKTLVVFTSDHGVLQGEHGLGGKNLMHEESIRVPLILRLPGTIPSGKTENALARNIDLASSLIDVAGVDIPVEMQGKSLLRLTEKSSLWDDDLFYCSGRGSNDQPFGPPFVMGIRTRDHKLMVYADGEHQIFDLKSDPFEEIDLADTPMGKKMHQSLLPRLNRASAFYGGPPVIAGNASP
jgi:arylsulfatase A-like enzyme